MKEKARYSGRRINLFKLFFSLFCIFAISFSSFHITSLVIEMHVNKDGTVDVSQTARILIEGEDSLASYISRIEKPELAAWQEILGNDKVRVYVDLNHAKVENLEVRPQPVYNYNPLTKIARGEIIITYKALPYKDKPDTGVFFVKQIKPRTYQLILNEKALSFKRTDKGNIILDEKTTLRFIPPENAVVVDINPIPKELRDVKLPARVDKVEWKDILLVSPVLVFEYEESIGEEIYRFSQNSIDASISFFSSPQGIIVLLFLLLSLFFYKHIRAKIKQLRTKAKER